MKSCKSCSINKISSLKGLNKIMKIGKANLSIVKPAVAGLAGFAAAKMLNQVPIGTGKTLGDNALFAGAAKIGVAMFAPGILGNKIPFAKDIAVGIAIAGVTDIVRKYMPSVATYIAAPNYPAGNPFKRQTHIACGDEEITHG